MRFAVKPLKHLAEVSVSNVDKKSVDGEIPVRLVNYTDVYHGDRLRPSSDLMKATASRRQLDQFQLRPNDVIITKDSETADDIGVPAFVEASEPRMVCGYHLALIRARPRQVHGRFLYWALSSDGVAGQLETGATGVTRFGLRADVIRSIEIPSPKLDDQRAIADYLDSEAARIDALIAKKRRMIQLLRELSEATLIHLSLERWLAGDRIPIKRAVRRRLEPAAPDSPILTAYRDGQVTSRALRRVDGYTLADNETNYLNVMRGDLVFHGLDGFAGAVGVAEVAGRCSPVYHVCEVSEPHSAVYLAAQIRALASSGFISLQASSVRQRAVDLRNWERFGSLPIALAEPAIQAARAEKINKVKDRSRSLEDKLLDQIDLLGEHRQGIVSRAVTGELTIPGVTL